MWKLCSSRITFPIFISGVAIGGFSGWFISDKHFSQISDKWNEVLIFKAASEGKLDARILQNLRSGEIENALNMLELRLDGNLMLISAMSDHYSAETIDRRFFTTLESIREYRKQHPREIKTPGIKKSIDKALSLQKPAENESP